MTKLPDTFVADHNKIEGNQTPFIVPLRDHAVICVSGPDAATYLQGQVSCDVNQAQDAPQLGCCCNIKGRVQVIFHLFVLPQAPETYYLAFPATMIEKTVARLNQYAMFSNVTIRVSDNITGLGCYCPGTTLALAADRAVSIPLSQDSYEVYASPSDIAEIRQQLCNSEQSIDTTIWRQQRIRHGLATIYPDSHEQFLAHDLNLHRVNGLNFNKGCYTGQEIISRMHYRAKLKNHMHRFILSAMAEIAPATAVINSEGKTVGQVVDCYHDNLLAIVNDKSLSQPLTVMGQETLTLTQQPLPYGLE